MLYNSNIAALTLGCLFKNPSLFNNSAYPLSKSDFSEIEMHKILFVCGQAISKTGCMDITSLEIDNFVVSYPVQKEILDDNNFFEFIDTIKELASLENFDYYYNIVRKFSLLRDLKNQGININKYYDETEEENKAQQKLNGLSIQDIISDIESSANKFRTKYDIKYVRDEIKAGEDTEELIERFKEVPSMGAMFQSGYLTTLFNGWNRGHLICRAGPSGAGKSRFSVADLCKVGATQLWDDNAKDFIPNSNYQSPTLFIATEQNIETEVQPMFYSAIANVNYSDITNGTLTKDQEKRIIKAGEIIRESNITITSMPRFTKQNLERKLKEKVSSEGIGYCCFDYMEVQGDLSAEFKQNNSTIPRQDLILLDLASFLKTLAEDYNVGILTGQQLNDSWKETKYIDESSLAGGKATKFKLDAGSIIIPIDRHKGLKKDFKILEPQFNIKRRGFGGNRVPMPNMCEFIFKSRYGTYGDRCIKLWSYFDKGTFQRYDYFCTDEENSIIKVPITEVKYEESEF